MKRGLFHIFANGLTDLISLRAYWCVSIGACFMQRKKVFYLQAIAKALGCTVDIIAVK